MIAGCGDDGGRAGAGTATAPTVRPSVSGPTADEKRQIWRALKTSEAACAGRRLVSATAAKIRRDVAMLAVLYRKYPDEGFVLPQVPDESAHMLSVLYLARHSLEPCVPWAAARIERVIRGG